jgi:hypothetical protein
MLGDAGANALGGMIGAAAAIALPRPARIAVLAGIAGLTAASEVVSFTKVIERTPPLRWLDMLGRRPAQGHGSGAESTAGHGSGQESPAGPASAPDGQGKDDGAWPPVVVPEQAAADFP